ncbi:MAG: hypothetical protein AAGA69_01490 [Pseudomonadota bacterium]
MKLILATVFVLLSAQTITTAASAGDENTSPVHDAMLEQWSYMLEGSGAWRTPNPDFSGEDNSPNAYEIRFEWGPYRQHVTGTLKGIFDTEDGETSVRYWTFYSWYHPKTEEITLMQIGTNGALGEGTFSIKNGDRQILDQVFYGPDGSTRAVRHETIENSPAEHTVIVFHADEDGEWQKVQEWVWTRIE